MNIEELELSLRSEFESQVLQVLAGVRKDTDDFKKHFEAEFEKHRAELERAIDDLSARLPQGALLDASFTETVSEHLRLARDDGAQVAAKAFGEAEKLKEATVQTARYDLIRNAISEISTKTSQAAILRSLVDHAGNFANRGAFFIARNDQLIGWSSFGEGASASEEAVRDIQLSSGSDTILAASLASLCVEEAVGGSHSEDGVFLDPLGFGRPEKLYAIPLVARGRGVAVLYADTGSGDSPVNLDALETIVRFAGLTVELLAASHMPRQEHASQADAPAPAAVEEVSAPAGSQAAFSSPAAEEAVAESQGFDHVEPAAEPEAAEPFAPVERFEPVEAVEEVEHFEGVEVVEDVHSAEPEVEEYRGGVSFEGSEQPADSATSFEPATVEEPVSGHAFQEYALETNSAPSYEAEADAANVTGFAFNQSDASEDGPVVDSFEDAEVVEPEQPAEAFSAPVPSVPDPEPVGEVSYAPAGNGNGNGHAAEPVVEVKAPSAGRTRLSDRNVDLPIEVADEERRLHNDARRFARLLVSEIKLYNEQKVAEGRESSDLYERLKEAIDRSREMYDKRVQPAVASKFDYFHYELVNSLAEGEPNKLGSGYPGAVV